MGAHAAVAASVPACLRLGCPCIESRPARSPDINRVGRLRDRLCWPIIARKGVFSGSSLDRRTKPCVALVLPRLAHRMRVPAGMVEAMDEDLVRGAARMVPSGG
ncbi:hypothetical protein ACTMU2_37395 [Cupriavidus basilensis]